tara:strand:- start:159 stop:569 length:411 start_codon:yes stop_codon:yes gene_type:complete
MTSTYGRAGGPTTQMVREFGDITVSSLLTSGTAQYASETILGPASGITGVADSYYRIWGYAVVTAYDDANYGYLESSDGSEDITPYAITNAGPLFQTLNLPIILEPNLGVRLRSLSLINTAGKTVIASVHFTAHAP